MEQVKRKMPKGGRKGGTTYPRVDLKKAVELSEKLVAKTHTGSQPASIILPGVFGSATSTGQTRASALKQYGLLEGSPKAYTASTLARDLNSAPPEEKQRHLRVACLRPSVFARLFATFQGDAGAGKAKVRQQVAALKVHPDLLDDCTELFLSSLESAGLANRDGDSITFSGGYVPAPSNGTGLELDDDDTDMGDDEDALPSAARDGLATQVDSNEGVDTHRENEPPAPMLPVSAGVNMP